MRYVALTFSLSSDSVVIRATVLSVGSMITNDSAVNTMPMPNLVTLEGSLFARTSLIHSQANTGASEMTNTEFAAWR